jgi:hypothetical protein
VEHQGRALAAVVVTALAIVLLLGHDVAAQDIAPDAAPSAGVTPDPVPGATAPAPRPAVQPSRTVTPVASPAPRARATTTVVTRAPAPVAPRAAVTPPRARRHHAAVHRRVAPIRLPVVRPPSWAVHVPVLPVAARESASNPDRTKLAGAGLALLLLAVASGALLNLLARGERLRPRA